MLPIRRHHLEFNFHSCIWIQVCVWDSICRIIIVAIRITAATIEISAIIKSSSFVIFTYHFLSHFIPFYPFMQLCIQSCMHSFIFTWHSFPLTISFISHPFICCTYSYPFYFSILFFQICLSRYVYICFFEMCTLVWNKLIWIRFLSIPNFLFLKITDVKVVS